MNKIVILIGLACVWVFFVSVKTTMTLDEDFLGALVLGWGLMVEMVCPL